jgi:ParB family chromosome partitioning protein
MDKSKTQQPLPSKKTDIHLVDITTVKIEEGFNVRRDYGDIDELAESIKENGVLQPLRCYKKNGEFVLVDGHRRHRACMKLVKEEGIQIRVKVVTEGRGVSPEQRIIDMMMLNEGKRLNPLEEAEAVNRLLNYGLEETEVSKKIGKSLVYISNLKLLNSAPEKIKVMVRSEQISSTLLLKLMRETNDFEELQDLIHTAFLAANEGNTEEPVKVTQKHVKKAQNKTNSVSALKKAFKVAEKQELVVNPQHEELYKFAKAIIDGDYTKENLLALFFKPSEDEADESFNAKSENTEPDDSGTVKDKPFETLD